MPKMYLQGLLTGNSNDTDTSSDLFTGAYEAANIAIGDSVLTVIVDGKGKVWAVNAGGESVAFTVQKIDAQSGPSYQQQYRDHRQVVPASIKGMRAKRRS